VKAKDNFDALIVEGLAEKNVLGATEQVVSNVLGVMAWEGRNVHHAAVLEGIHLVRILNALAVMDVDIKTVIAVIAEGIKTAMTV